MNPIYLKFKKEVDKEYMITTLDVNKPEITVWIDDIRKDWQLPIEGMKFNNPKVKKMSKEEFDKTFELL